MFDISAAKTSPQPRNEDYGWALLAQAIVFIPRATVAQGNGVKRRPRERHTKYVRDWCAVLVYRCLRLIHVPNDGQLTTLTQAMASALRVLDPLSTGWGGRAPVPGSPHGYLQALCTRMDPFASLLCPSFVSQPSPTDIRLLTARPLLLRPLHEYNWTALPPKSRAPCLPPMKAKRARPIRTLSLDLENHLANRVPVARGGFGDVFKLCTPEHGILAVKRPNFNETERKHLEAMVMKEAAVLTMIGHTHILPFLGISYMGDVICLISPWAENGPLRLYLAKNPEADRLRLLAQVASALSYLHTSPGDIVVHGDLHVDNVLISKMGTALLSDFGLSRIVPAGNSSSLWRGDGRECSGFGIAAYTAPELCDNDGLRSWASDVFAFGMLVFHSYSGHSPFGPNRNQFATIIALYAGQRPARGEIKRNDFSDDLWCLVQQCWTHTPRQRPRMPAVSRAMQSLLDRHCLSADSQGRAVSLRFVGLRTNFMEGPPVLVFLSHASGFIVMWLKRPLKGHSPSPFFRMFTPAAN